MGVSEDKQICHCFSCGFAGDFAKFLMYSLPDDFGFNANDDKTYFRGIRKARQFLSDRYELEYRELSYKTKMVKRYEDTLIAPKQERHEIPLYKIAPFKSGKETYKYYYDRGFEKEDVKKFMVGRDLENKTVTIPAFYQDGTLAGVIGRYISAKRKKNERYKIYDFPRGEILYPMNFYEPLNDTMILVEGMFDAQRMIKLGYINTQAKMGVELTPKQANLVCDNCETLIYIGDNDERGLEGREHDRKLLGGRVNFLIVDYPDYGKDPCDWDKDTIDEMVRTAHSPIKRKLRRL